LSPTESRLSSDPTPSTNPWTVRRVLEWTTGYLAEHGSESPRLEAEILLAHARGCPRIALYTHIDDELSEDVRSRMRSMVQRRAKREPVAYLVGHREFFSLNFEITPAVFIPRPETETLVMETLSAIKGLPQPRVLELCTGSGCIPIAVAVHAPQASVTAVERSEAALEVARRNAQRHNVAGRVTFHSGDLFSPIDAETRFDVIVSNPPYIATTDTRSVEADVRLHEPHEALFAGADGLDVIRRIINEAAPYLVPEGTLLLEFSPEQAETIVQLFEDSGQYEEVTILPDLSALSRTVRARRKP
jgi:release factor glutamine methyltransferase